MKLEAGFRVLRLLGAGNQALLRSTSEQDLLHKICNIAVEIGGYKMAWVGYVDTESGDKTVEKKARAGEGTEYLDSIVVRWDGDPLGLGPSGAAIRSGKPVVCRIDSDPFFGPWRAVAIQHGYASTLALPLTDGGAVFGVLRIYSSDPDAFGVDEVEMLQELSHDLAFGINAKRSTERLHKTEKALRESQEHLRRLAFYDSLTGLPNRALFMDRLQQAVATAGRQGWSVGVLFMDLNHFKEINDTKGHQCGDQVLVAFADRLRSVFRAEDSCARFGGDEFAVLVQETDTEGVKSVLDRLEQALQEPIFVCDNELHVSSSVGISFYPRDSREIDRLMSYADIAMYRAKMDRRPYCFYHQDLGERFERCASITRQLRTALANGEMQIYFQPKISLETGKIVGAEALLRWLKNDVVFSCPAEFIPMIEQKGLMPDLGEWALAQACSHLSEWKKAGVRFPGRVSVNISPKQIDTLDFVCSASRIVKEYGIDPSEIELELTEGCFSEDIERMRIVLSALRGAGFLLAIDDFGTGYSSLAKIQNLPVTTIKIDKSFVQNLHLELNCSGRVLIEAIVSMAKTLGLVSVAEGVEEESHVQILKDVGCDEVQGFLLGHPLSADEFAMKWLT